MFTIDQIKQAHSKVKTGADFPRYVQDLIQLGVTSYSSYLMDGHIEYAGRNGFRLTSAAVHPAREIATESDSEKLKHYIEIHQQGGSDYPTICGQAAETGVEKWTVDMVAMTCTYYDKAGSKMLVELIPIPQ